MSNIEIVSLIVTIICLVSFSIVFTVLFRNYYTHLIKDVKEGKEDIALIENAIYEEQRKNKTQHKVFSIIGKVLGWSLLGVVIVGFSLSLYSRFTSNNMMFGDTGYIVIASGSMEERNPANTYLDTYDLNDQIKTYDIIEIKKYNSQDDIKLYDVVAFKNEHNVTIVHRIIEIRADGTYLTKGDSNEASDFNIQYDGYLKYENIVGKYTGNNIPTLGIFVVFLQSNSGIITVVSIIYCMLMFDYLKSKYENAIFERSETLINLTNYDLNKEEVDDVSVDYSESLCYKGSRYIFKEGQFVEKIALEDVKDENKTNNTNEKSVKIKTKVLKINNLDSKNDETK